MTSATDPSRGGRLLPRRELLGLVVAVVVVGGLVAWRLVGGTGGTPQDFEGPTMGTMYLVRVDADMSAGERARAAEAIRLRLDRVNRLMSTYDTASELSRLNRSRSTEPVTVSADLIRVLTIAARVSERTGGAFDVTVAPLVDAWGFGPDGRPERWPDAHDLTLLRARIGTELITVDAAARTVAKGRPDTRMDLSAVAKGYGVDEVASALVDLGYGGFLVEVGGELKAVGRRRDGSRWRVGIERPEVGARALFGALELEDMAIATSGDYRNFYDEDGARYAHIIDPRSGMPIAFAGAAVSVLHEEAAVADAWATALTVLGPDEGYDLAEREGVAAIFVVRTDGGFDARHTTQFLARAIAYTEAPG